MCVACLFVVVVAVAVDDVRLSVCVPVRLRGLVWCGVFVLFVCDVGFVLVCFVRCVCLFVWCLLCGVCCLVVCLCACPCDCVCGVLCCVDSSGCLFVGLFGCVFVWVCLCVCLFVWFVCCL